MMARVKVDLPAPETPDKRIPVGANGKRPVAFQHAYRQMVPAQTVIYFRMFVFQEPGN